MIVGKWLQMLLEVAPSLRSIAFVYNPRTIPQGLLHALETFAPSAPVRFVAAPVHEPIEIDATFAEFARQQGGGLMIVVDTLPMPIMHTSLRSLQAWLTGDLRASL